MKCFFFRHLLKNYKIYLRDSFKKTCVLIIHLFAQWLSSLWMRKSWYLDGYLPSPPKKMLSTLFHEVHSCFPNFNVKVFPFFLQTLSQYIFEKDKVDILPIPGVSRAH